MRIRILFEGKTKDARLRAIQQDLAARIEHFIPLSLEELPSLRGASHSRKEGLTSTERACARSACPMLTPSTPTCVILPLPS